MANTKISGLPSATTPLAGTEVLPIVQSSATVKVATDDLTVKNIRSNTTTGILQVVGPAAGSTRVATVPNANFTVARTDAAQTFTGTQTVQAAATQDAVKIAGRAGGTLGYSVTITPSTLTSDSTVTLPDASTIIPIASQALTFNGPTAARTVTLPDANTTLPQASYVITYSGITAGRTITLPNANFTAARTDAAQSFTGDQTLSTGNLVIGTSGKGIDFSATADPASGMTSELLADYEEGTWTPVVTAGSGTITTVGTVIGSYTKVGRQVTIWGSITVTTNGTGASYINITGIPYTSASTIGSYGGTGANGSTAKFVNSYVIAGGTTVRCWYYDATYPIASGQTITFAVSYFV